MNLLGKATTVLRMLAGTKSAGGRPQANGPSLQKLTTSMSLCRSRPLRSFTETAALESLRKFVDERQKMPGDPIVSRVANSSEKVMFAESLFSHNQ